jgi:hypothetical protein
MPGSAPLMEFTRAPWLPWHEQPPPESGVTWCSLCQCGAPRLFDVPDDVWLHYVGPAQCHRVLCIRCWQRLTHDIDRGAYQAGHGAPVPLWSDQWRVRHGIPPDEPCPMPAKRLRRFTIAARVRSGRRRRVYPLLERSTRNTDRPRLTATMHGQEWRPLGSPAREASIQSDGARQISHL